MAAERRIAIEVVHATCDVQQVLAMSVAEGTTIEEAIRLSGLLEREPAIGPAGAGIYGHLARPDTVLRQGDRVEIYRPLLVEPGEARRLRTIRPC